MDERALRGLIAKVKVGKLSRRAFVHKMIALGLTAPMASQMLDFCGVARAQTAFQYKPTKRGGGGAPAFWGGNYGTWNFSPQSMFIPRRAPRWIKRESNLSAD